MISSSFNESENDEPLLLLCFESLIIKGESSTIERWHENFFFCKEGGFTTKVPVNDQYTMNF